VETGGLGASPARHVVVFDPSLQHSNAACREYPRDLSQHRSTDPDPTKAGSDDQGNAGARVDVRLGVHERNDPTGLKGDPGASLAHAATELDARSRAGEVQKALEPLPTAESAPRLIVIEPGRNDRSLLAAEGADLKAVRTRTGAVRRIGCQILAVRR
jgi:hypothetical protein